LSRKAVGVAAAVTAIIISPKIRVRGGGKNMNRPFPKVTKLDTSECLALG